MKCSPLQLRIAKIGYEQACRPKKGSLQSRIAKNSELQMRFGQNSPSQMCSSEIGTLQAASHQVSSETSEDRMPLHEKKG